MFQQERANIIKRTLAKHDQIKEAIQQILGWMVLASVDDSYIKNLGSAPDYPSVYFELPVETPAGVELIVSRRFQRQAKFKSDGSTITGLNHLCVSSGTV